MEQQKPPRRSRAEACEASRASPGGVILVTFSPRGDSRRLTVPEARDLVEQLNAAIARAESGEPLPAVPKNPRTNQKA